MPSAAPALEFEGRRIVCTGGRLRTAAIFDEVWLDLPPLSNPFALLEAIERSGLRADLFTFAQSLPNIAVEYPDLHLDHDNLAVGDTSNFKKWWDGLPQESRKNCRKAQKRGIAVRPAAFDAAFVAGIKEIYDETPVRQGRKFPHYGKDLATVRAENASYAERSRFIGAFLGEQLIGFIKLVYCGRIARIMQIIARNDHYEKHPTNALLAAAMEQCSKDSIDRLIYGQYVYGKKRSSSVTEFKRRNGFTEVLLPRYYLPLTAKGRLALAANLHRGLAATLPEPVTNFLLDSRAFVYDKLGPKFQGGQPSSAKPRTAS
jgi:hypothetical protein